MKKSHLFSAAAAATLLLAGCTTVESTQKFNAMGLGTPTEKAICQTYVQIPYFYLFGCIPLFGGSPKGDGEFCFFSQSLTTENVVYLLTKEAKQKGAARVVNVTVSRTAQSLMMCLLTKETIQASGTGVRSKQAAVDRARQDYDTAL